MRASKSHLHAEPPLLDLTSVAHAVWGAVCIANKPFSLQKLARTAIRAVTVASISITVGTVNNAGNEKVTVALSEGLITQNRQRIYRIDDNIPVMLESESIPADQFEGL